MSFRQGRAKLLQPTKNRHWVHIAEVSLERSECLKAYDLAPRPQVLVEPEAQASPVRGEGDRR
jgi:hypothetical protein